MLPLNGHEIIAPDTAEIAMALESYKVLSSQIALQNGDYLELRDPATGTALKLPPSAAKALLQVLKEMGRGNAVVVSHIYEVLSTPLAADLLNLSIPFVIKLVQDGTIPCQEVSGEHRFLLKDLLAYRQDNHEKRMKALEELSALSQELGLYDDKRK